jgi:DNA-directed RNA polymerase II subunit RPB1
MVDNQIAGQPQDTYRNGKPLKTIRQRLVGKEGRVRGNLMGKRVDYSGRTVITADPILSMQQVGVPRSIASNLTVREYVTSFNRDRLHELVARGPNLHPGANYIERDNGQRVDLKHCQDKNELMLELGWIVERHLQDGDVVLFNRQPSLHKMSIMAHFAKVLDFSTFRLNLSCTPPYNADFDGDEMNLHVPQSLEARAEAEELMLTPRMIVSPQGNKPVMSIVQDSLLGSAKMTTRDTFIERDLLFYLIMWLRDWDGRIPIPAVMVPKKDPMTGKRRDGEYDAYWTGKQMFSMFCPKVNVRSKMGTMFSDLALDDKAIIIDDGELISGRVDKKVLGKGAGALIHVTWLELGPFACRDLIDQVQVVINHWLINWGFTIGVGDTVAGTETLQEITRIISKAKDNVARLVKEGQSGELKSQPGMSLYASFESLVNQALNGARDKAGNFAAESLGRANNFKATVSSGSKGSNVNIAQILACVGQQNVEGKRIKNGFTKRSLPHFMKDDLGPEARGFVENSYLKGLSPQEFYFHAMGGREGLIDTACKTAETGYIQRRLVKALESVMCQYDGTVRNAEGHIIQFLYGEDGMSGEYCEFQEIGLLNMSDKKFHKKYSFFTHARGGGGGGGGGNLDDEDMDMEGGAGAGASTAGTAVDEHMGYEKRGSQYVAYLDRSVIKDIQTDIDLQNILREEYRALEADRVELRKIAVSRGREKAADVSFVLPVNFERLILKAQRQFRVDFSSPTDLHPRKVVQRVKQLLKELVVVKGDDDLSVEAQRNATVLFSILTRSHLAAKRVLKDYRLSEAAFENLLGEISVRFQKAFVNPGEMCGVIAAQSIGEPATQMTLNTFHFAGVSSKNVTLGVPRLKEIINVSKSLKTPGIEVHLMPEYRADQDKAQAVIKTLEYTTLRSITRYTEIVFDPDPKTSVIEADKEVVTDFWDTEFLEDMSGESVDAETLSPWVLRIVLDNAKFTVKGAVMSEIADAISEKYEGGALFTKIYSDDNNAHLVLRIGLINDPDDEDDDDMGTGEPEGLSKPDNGFLERLESDLLDNLCLGGIRGIEKVYIRNEKVQRWTENKDADGEPIPGTGRFEREEDWLLDTDGTNLLEVLGLDEVDHTSTISNDICEIAYTLGIEAVRKSIMREISKCLSTYGLYVNYRHLGTLCDVMTSRGYIMAITRHGTNRCDHGAIQRASFEETVELLFDSACHAERDQMMGPSANILLGQLCPVGTGLFDMILDDEALMNNPTFSATAADDDEMVAKDDPGADVWVPQQSPAVEQPFDSPMVDVTQLSPEMDTFKEFMSPDVDAEEIRQAGGVSASPAAYASGRSPADWSASPGLSDSAGSASPSSVSPSSPAYSPSSPAYSPSSPAYSPSSPAYSPSSPAYSPSSPAYSPSSPAYSPSSPAYSPSSPAGSYSPTSPAYSPTSPAYSPTSPAYSPTSPAYSPTSPQGSYSPTSPAYSPTSPAYSPTSPQGSYS